MIVLHMLYPITLLNLLVLGVFHSYLSVFYVGNHIIDVFPFQTACLLFHLLVLMHWMELPALCGIRVVRIDILTSQFYEKSF